MHQKKPTDNTAVMDIVGRDRPGQELTIVFDQEPCIWKFQKAETELWKQPSTVRKDGKTLSRKERA